MNEIIDFLKNKVLNSDKYYEHEDFVREIKEIINKEEHIKKIDEKILDLCRDSLTIISLKKKIANKLKSEVELFIRKEKSQKNIEEFKLLLIHRANLLFKQANAEWDELGEKNSRMGKLIENDLEYIVDFIHYVKKISHLDSLKYIDENIYQTVSKDLIEVYNQLNQEQAADARLEQKMPLLGEIIKAEKVSVVVLKKLGPKIDGFFKNADIRSKFFTVVKRKILEKSLLPSYNKQEEIIKSIELREIKKIQLIKSIMYILKTDKKDLITKKISRGVIHLPVMDVTFDMRTKFDSVLRKEVILKSEREQEKIKVNSLLRGKGINRLLMTTIEDFESNYGKTAIKRKEIRQFAVKIGTLTNIDIIHNDTYHLIAYSALLNYKHNRNTWSQFGETEFTPIIKQKAFRINYFLVGYSLTKITNDKQAAREMKKALMEIAA